MANALRPSFKGQKMKSFIFGGARKAGVALIAAGAVTLAVSGGSERAYAACTTTNPGGLVIITDVIGALVSGLNVNCTGGINTTDLVNNSVTANKIDLTSLTGALTGANALNSTNLDLSPTGNGLVAALNGLGGGANALTFNSLNSSSLLTGLNGTAGLTGNALALNTITGGLTGNLALGTITHDNLNLADVVKSVGNNLVAAGGGLAANAADGKLSVLTDGLGGLNIGASGLGIKLATNSGLNVDANGLGINIGAGLLINTTTGAVDVSVGTAQIQDGSVTESKLANNSVSTRTIQDGAVTESKLANDSVSTRTIQDNAVTESKLANNSVSTRTIQDGAVTESKLADDSVSTRTLQDGSVTESKLANNSVTWNKLGADVRHKIDKQSEGIAIASALVNPDLISGERFGFTVNYGNFEGESGIGFGVQGVLAKNLFGGGERLALTGAAGVGTTHGTASGRVGAQFTW